MEYYFRMEHDYSFVLLRRRKPDAFLAEPSVAPVVKPQPPTTPRQDAPVTPKKSEKTSNDSTDPEN